MGTLAEELIKTGVASKKQINQYAIEQTEKQQTQDLKNRTKWADNSPELKKLPPDEQHIVGVLVEKFIFPVKINPDSIQLRIIELEKFLLKHKNETKWMKAIDATIRSFINIKIAINHHQPSREEFEAMLADKKNKLVRFPNYYYVFHPHG